MSPRMRPFSQMIEQERRRWMPFRRALSKEDQGAFDRMLLWFNENGHLDKGDKLGKGGVPQWQRNDATMAMHSSERRSGW
jgi:hypothetical protein